jgi:festuclavine dehydrogenase
MATSSSSVLVVGGFGKTGSRLAHLLHSAGIQTIRTSRSPKTITDGTGVSAILDWQDTATHSNAFDAVKQHQLPPIHSAYLVCSHGVPDFEHGCGFIRYAAENGVRRFVLLSLSAIPEGGPFQGKIHAYLKKQGEKGVLEWAVLRPTWFQGKPPGNV